MSNNISKRIQKRYFNTEKASDDSQDFPNNGDIYVWTLEIEKCLAGNWDDIIQGDPNSDIHGLMITCMEDKNSKVYRIFRSVLKEALEKAAIQCADEHGY